MLLVIQYLTWLSNNPARRTKSTSNTQDFNNVTWSSWCKHLNPGMSFAKVQTCRTWSINLSENCSWNVSSERPFIGHVWKNKTLWKLWSEICIPEFMRKKRYCFPVSDYTTIDTHRDGCLSFYLWNKKSRLQWLQFFVCLRMLGNTFFASCPITHGIENKKYSFITLIFSVYKRLNNHIKMNILCSMILSW